ncbi:MAG: hypothetical protein V2A74_01760 [bacterium]
MPSDEGVGISDGGAGDGVGAGRETEAERGLVVTIGDSAGGWRLSK